MKQRKTRGAPINPTSNCLQEKLLEARGEAGTMKPPRVSTSVDRAIDDQTSATSATSAMEYQSSPSHQH